MNLTNLSRLKLEQVASVCGSTLAATRAGQLLADPLYDITAVAGALSTSQAWLQRALDLPEPIAYPPLISSNV